MSAAEPTSQTTSESSLTLLRLINGFHISQMICTAAKFGLADLVAEGPKTSTELAEPTGLHAPSLYRLLRALSSVGVFSEDEQGCFGLTPLAEQLRTGVSGSLRTWAMYSGDSPAWLSWGKLDHTVQTGETAFHHVFGMDAWDYRAQNADANALFNAAMTGLSSRDISAVLAAYDFSAVSTIVDVGGGHGALMTAILRAHPSMHGILVDLPHVVATAAPMLEAAGVDDRCELVGGTFFEAVPRGGDAYLLRRVIHDWDDDQSAAILRTCHHAMAAHAKLLLVEEVIHPGNDPDPSKLSDINMMVMLGGRERTEGEFRALLARAGFVLAKVYPTSTQSSIIEGRPA